jgi:hypothetical protein
MNHLNNCYLLKGNPIPWNYLMLSTLLFLFPRKYTHDGSNDSMMSDKGCAFSLNSVAESFIPPVSPLKM